MTTEVSKESVAAKIRELEQQKEEIAQRANAEIMAINFTVQTLKSLVDPPKIEELEEENEKES